MPGGCCRCGPFRVNIVPQGLLKPYLLHLLSQRSMHGFEIMEEIFRRTKGIWRPGPSAIYPTLSWLEDKGYVRQLRVEGRGEKARRPFEITKEGEKALEDYRSFKDEWLEGVSVIKELWD